MRLRDVGPADLDAYVRMRCDPVMMAELGGPLPREGIEGKVRRDAGQAAGGTEWIKMIIPDETAPDVVAGSVVLWSHEEGGAQLSEIGWMVLPEFQGRGIGKRAVLDGENGAWLGFVDVCQVGPGKGCRATDVEIEFFLLKEKPEP
ncbi:MAG TPA: hypothetical protein DHU96_01335, partial [Actinobacteria bacterium]|nr:hypothetical protein [Actinomycetota bacterium]